MRGPFGLFRLLLTLGKPKESAEEVRKAKELDPLSLRRILRVAFHLYVTREYNEALLEARRGLELYPDARCCTTSYQAFHAQTEQPRLAAEEALKPRRVGERVRRGWQRYGSAYEASGTKVSGEAVELNKEVAGQQYLNAFDIAND